jgi:hypothetical protein
MQTPALWEEEAQIRGGAAIVLQQLLFSVYAIYYARCRKRFARGKYIIHGSVLQCTTLAWNY